MTILLYCIQLFILTQLFYVSVHFHGVHNNLAEPEGMHLYQVQQQELQEEQYLHIIVACWLLSKLLHLRHCKNQQNLKQALLSPGAIGTQ